MGKLISSHGGSRSTNVHLSCVSASNHFRRIEAALPSFQKIRNNSTIATPIVFVTVLMTNSGSTSTCSLVSLMFYYDDVGATIISSIS